MLAYINEFLDWSKVIKDGNPVDNIYRFSAPDADIGWDSDLNQYYLGFTFYNIASYNKALKVDLPVFIDLEKASRHDALTCISAFARMTDINPQLRPRYMCLDSASDSVPIYQFYQHHNVIPVIDHNQRGTGKKKVPIAGQEYLNNDGIPVCANGTSMVYDGYNASRFRKKYRCPLATGKIEQCPFQDSCSTSSYGRTVYVKDDSSPRNSGPLSYRSAEWIRIYKNRTSCERINTRVLNNYHLHQMHIRNGSKHAFFAIFAGINIHLDAWIKNER